MIILLFLLELLLSLLLFSLLLLFHYFFLAFRVKFLQGFFISQSDRLTSAPLAPRCPDGSRWVPFPHLFTQADLCYCVSQARLKQPPPLPPLGWWCVARDLSRPSLPEAPRRHLTLFPRIPRYHRGSSGRVSPVSFVKWVSLLARRRRPRKGLAFLVTSRS